MSGPDADGLARLVGELEAAVRLEMQAAADHAQQVTYLGQVKHALREWMGMYRGTEAPCAIDRHDRFLDYGHTDCPSCGVVLAEVIADA